VYGGQAPLVKGGPATGGSEVDTFVKAVENGDLAAYVEAVTPADRPKPTPGQAKAIAQILFNGKDVQALAAAGQSFSSLRVTAKELGRCKAPVLFIYGSKEPDRLRECVANAQKILGQGEVKVVEGADHMTTLIKPEFGKAIIEFIKTHKTD